MTYLTVTQLETSRRLVRAELERARASAERRRVERPRRGRRLLRTVRAAAA